MTLEQIRNIVNFIINQQKPEMDPVSYERLSDLIQMNNLELFKREADKKNYDNLRPFIVSRDGVNLAYWTVDANGFADLPDDFYQTMSLVAYFKDGDEYVHRVVPKKSREIFDDHLMSKVEHPTVKYPIYTLEDNKMLVAPKGIYRFVYTYLRYPKEVNFAFKVENGVNVYDTVNSVELEWEERMQVDVVLLTLSDLGIRIGRAELVNYVNSEEIKTGYIKIER